MDGVRCARVQNLSKTLAGTDGTSCRYRRYIRRMGNLQIKEGMLENVLGVHTEPATMSFSML